MTLDSSYATRGGPMAPATEEPAAAGSNAIAVGSGKGGVGKTWLSVTLSHALARRARNVLLFDGDLGLANVDVQLGLVPRHDLGGVLAGRRSLSRSVERFAPGGFDILAGRSGSGALARLSPGRLSELRERLFRFAARYDHAILDTGSGINATARSMATSAATSLVLTTDEPTALTDAYAFIKVMASEGHAGNVRIVVNMAADERQGRHTYQTLLRACETFLGLSPPLAGIIRRDPHVADAIRHQTPFLTRHPNSDAARDVERLAGDIGDMP